MLRYAVATWALLALMTLPLRADPNLAAGLAQIRAGDWQATRAAMARIDDPAVADVLMWHLLRNRQGDFEEATAFLARNPNWPGEPLLLSRVESVLPATTPPAALIAHFETYPPNTSRGALMYAISLRAAGRGKEAEALVIDWWLTQPMPVSSHAGFIELFGDILAPYHAARMDALAWAGEVGSAERMLPLVPDGPEATLALARIALRDGRPGVDALIEAVPENWRNHQALAYERFRWRLARGRRDDALELLFAYDQSADALGNPAAWASHRLRLARGLKQDGRPADGYRVAARHHLADGAEEVPQLEWLAGYIALRFLDDPAAAVAHFRRFEANVGSPISKGRAFYWLGRALEATGDAEGALAAWRAGGRYQTSFYGQLAAERAGLPADPLLTGEEVFPPFATSAMAGTPIMRAAVALHAIGEDGLAERFFAHMAETLPRAEIGTLIDEILRRGEPHIALITAKRAAQRGFELHRGYFPVTELAAIDSPVTPELTLAIARRESEFDPVVVSPAGARGLMQLMPGTAEEMARDLELPYRLGQLTTDPLFNATLGTAYIMELEAEFGPSAILVPAAYNAGPSRAREWVERFGDPSDPAADLVDWIEDVPFSETRNYIMRVSESLLPYRARLTGDPGDVRLTHWLREGYDELRAQGG
ncbi:transglycosylase SLT domain-containing protein [Jannaschia seohaensis]|uniref:Soluble lytic murein transglycosylase n=1 Tax=Jannaschia seohaensis TaxID=475081 RepID=A0A2Y9A386_9RHOB|nr:transglycosylase SLT domain-containing protein [Jannaschia seohaensis]PWJ22407.1 soluble lytic murein transglycosylase [Jannaschia seohaensis]SSA38685.1 soluble lytic murein transglycosylase [Jannaschia seohaensis]